MTPVLNIDELSNEIDLAIKAKFCKNAMLLRNLDHTLFIVLKSVMDNSRLGFAQIAFPEDSIAAVVASRCPLCKEKATTETVWAWHNNKLVRIADMDEKSFILLIDSMIRPEAGNYAKV